MNAQILSYMRLTRKTTPGPRRGNASSCDQLSSPATRRGGKVGSPSFFYVLFLHGQSFSEIITTCGRGQTVVKDLQTNWQLKESLLADIF
ncbi:unnamed protein product [Larinioides sclopetarius]|uniref:Uncharacterized protein n=1 Tax=Larinioides sclopetarius TaxID=280406 RepID=A0AAV1ZY79_9ARAC